MLEGPDLVLAAVAAGAHLEAVYFDDRASAPGRQACDMALSAASAAGVPLIELAPGVLDRVCDAVTPQPIVGVATLPDTGIAIVPAVGFVVVLADVRDPGNLGTAIRSADASGSAGVVVSGESVDVFNPKTLRATAGSVFHIPVAVVSTLRDAVASMRGSGRRVLGAVVDGGTELWDAPLDGHAAVVIGSEAAGLSVEDRSLLDGTVSIPMSGRAESLNAGVATAIICFESLRRRTSAGGSPPTI